MTVNKSALTYRRTRNARVGRRSLCCGTLFGLPDLPETALPRLQERVLLSHRRGQKRMKRWTKNYG